MKSATLLICLALLLPAFAQAPRSGGHWVEESYLVGCGGTTPPTTVQSYVTASMVDSKGEPACRTGPNGNFLRIHNSNQKTPVHFGLSGVLNEELGPGETKTDNVSPYYQVNKPPMPFEQRVTIKYWVAD